MLDLIIVLVLGIILGAQANFVLLLLDKWKVLEYYELHRPQNFPSVCIFCLGFWLSCITFLIFFSISSESFKAIYLAALPIAAIFNNHLS